MEILFLIGRIVLGAYYLFNAFNHFRNLEMMTGYAASKGVPAPKLAVAGTGVLLLLGGLSILLGYQPTIGVLLIVVFLVPVAFMMHNFWAVQDPQMKMAEMVNFMKNIALAASALMFLAIPQPWPFSLGG
uniref:DoxX family membrane protein n=1 Tax=Caldilinea aerophila TaxID=133453 RepID=A0A7C1JUB4_9CHLR